MSVVGAFTGGNDAGTSTTAATPALNINGAGTPVAGDATVCFEIDAGNTTISSSAPTHVAASGPTVVGTILTGYNMVDAALTAAEITTNTIVFTWSAGNRNLGNGLLLRGADIANRVSGTPATGTTGASITIPTITAPAGSDVMIAVATRVASTTASVPSSANMTGAGYTIGRAVVTAYTATSQFAMTTAYQQNVAAGSIGGTSIALSGSPTASIAWIIAVPPLPAFEALLTPTPRYY